MSHVFNFYKNLSITKKHLFFLPLIDSCTGINNQEEGVNSQEKYASLNSLNKNKEGKLLVCFDFDRTIINESAYFQLNRSYLSGGDGLLFMFKGKIQSDNPDKVCENYNIEDEVSQTRSLLKDSKITLRKPQGLRKLMCSLLGAGHKIAITTRGDYLGGIKVVLEKLGFTEDEIKTIPIIASCSPEKAKFKIQHIKKALELLGMGDNSRIILVEDDPKQVYQALLDSDKITCILIENKFEWKIVEDIAIKLMQIKEKRIDVGC